MTDGTVHGPEDVVKGIPFHVALKESSTTKPGATASKIFFFAMRFGSAATPSCPGKVTRSPIAAPAGGSTNSTFPSADVAHKTMPVKFGKGGEGDGGRRANPKTKTNGVRHKNTITLYHTRGMKRYVCKHTDPSNLQSQARVS